MSKKEKKWKYSFAEKMQSSEPYMITNISNNDEKAKKAKKDSGKGK